MLCEVLAHLSEESRRLRFLGAKPRFTGAELRYLTEVDGCDHYALVAQLADDPLAIVAVARFVRLAGGRGAAGGALLGTHSPHRPRPGTPPPPLLRRAGRRPGSPRLPAS